MLKNDFGHILARAHIQYGIYGELVTRNRDDREKKME